MRRFPRALLLGLAALVPRIFYIATLGRHIGIEPVSDATEYDAFARLMMTGWNWVTTPLAVREPLYPAFMALAYSLPGPDLGALKLLQALLGAVSVVVLYWGLRSCVRESVAALSALLVAINPYFIVWAAEPLRENLVIPLLIGFFVCFMLAVARTSVFRLFSCALLFTLLAHTDVRFLPLIVVVPVMVFTYYGKIGLALRRSAWIGLFFAVLMIPYQIRGSVAMGKPVVITERFLGKFLPRAARLAPEGESGRTDKRQVWLEQWEVKKRERFEQLTPEEQRYFNGGGRPSTGRGRVYWILFIEYWRFARSKPMYRPFPDGRFVTPWSLRHNLAGCFVMIPFLVLLPFVVLGLPSGERRVALVILVFLAAHSLMHVLVHAVERYRMPMGVLMDILLAMALVNLWSLLNRKKKGVVQSRGPVA